MRGQYSFALAHLCGVPPNVPLRLADFIRLVLEIDAYLAAQEGD